MPAEMTIGALARASSVKVETIRYYERIGLMRAPPRSAGGYRLYDDADSARLIFIRRGRELGFSLDDITALLDMSGRHAPCAEIKPVAEAHLADVRARIADLRRLEAALARAVRACPGDATDAACPILEDLFAGRENA